MTGVSTILQFGFDRHVQGRFFERPRCVRLADGSSVRLAGPSFECHAGELLGIEDGEAVEVSGFSVHRVERILMSSDDDSGRVVIELA